MDRYQRVQKPMEEAPYIENEMRVTALGRIRRYINYATNLLKEDDSNKIVVRAMGKAINKTVMIVERIKKRVAGLHQITAIGSIYINDSWEPLEEGLLPVETTRHVSIIVITLSKQELDRSSVGYQSTSRSDQLQPCTKYDNVGDQLKPNAKYDNAGGKTAESSPAGQGRSRGDRSRGNGPDMVDSGDGDKGNRRRINGRGSSGRSRGRGKGGSGVPLDNKQEADGHSKETPPLKGRVRRRGQGRSGGKGQDARSNGPINASAGDIN